MVTTVAVIILTISDKIFQCDISEIQKKVDDGDGDDVDVVDDDNIFYFQAKMIETHLKCLQPTMFTYR